MKKNHLSPFAVIAIIAAFGLAAFTHPKNNGKFADVILTFRGDPLIAAQIADETKWVEDTVYTCPGAQNKGCAIEVDASNLTGTAPNRHLDVSKINLGAQAGVGGAANGYVPFKQSGAGTISNTYNKN